MRATVMMVLGFLVALYVYQLAPGTAQKIARRHPAALPVPAQQVVFRRALRRDLRASGLLARPPVLEGRRRHASSTGSAPTASRRASSTSRGSRCKLQTGYVYHYAFAMLIGVAAFITWYRRGRSALMFGFGILTGLTFLPLVGAAFILTLQGEDEATLRNANWAALLTTIVVFLLSLVAWARFDTASAAFQLVEQKSWFGSGLIYKMGVDGISMPFVLLTTFLMPFCILASWESITFRVKEYMVAFLVLETLMIGVFCALDLVLFYLFFEGGLIPMFLIIGIWGGKRRIYASFKFFLYTLLGSLLMLLAILAMYGKTGTTDIVAAAQDAIPVVDADMAVARLLRLLRGEDADVAGPHLAARRARRGADGGLGHPGRPFC